MVRACEVGVLLLPPARAVWPMEVRSQRSPRKSLAGASLFCKLHSRSGLTWTAVGREKGVKCGILAGSPYTGPPSFHPFAHCPAPPSLPQGSSVHHLALTHLCRSPEILASSLPSGLSRGRPSRPPRARVTAPEPRLAPQAGRSLGLQRRPAESHRGAQGLPADRRSLPPPAPPAGRAPPRGPAPRGPSRAVNPLGAAPDRASPRGQAPVVGPQGRLILHLGRRCGGHAPPRRREEARWAVSPSLASCLSI